jgi:hypothetical protein
MTIYAANYVLPNQDDVFARQMGELSQAIQNYGPQNFAGLAVGNEFMLE